jgi:hypothetical protein
LWQPCGHGFDALREYGGREMMLLYSACMFSEKVCHYAAEIGHRSTRKKTTPLGCDDHPTKRTG